MSGGVPAISGEPVCFNMLILDPVTSNTYQRLSLWHVASCAPSIVSQVLEILESISRTGEDRQVGLGMLGLANLLRRYGVTYEQFGRALEQYNAGQCH